MAGTTTVVFTDIAASTELVHRLGDNVAASVVAEHLRLVGSQVEQRHGTVAKTLGDGMMALFRTAYDGVLASVGMQQAVERTARQGKAPKLGLRIGVHVGDVVDDGSDDVFGAAVVVARRLCDVAAAGQVLASEVVRLLVANRPDIEFGPAVELTLKGIPEPVLAAAVPWTPLPDELPVRVVVADDSALVRSGVVRLLRDEGFEVVAEATDYGSLVSAVDRVRPDLVITDIRMPPDHHDEGLRAAEYVRATYPEMAILILSQHVEASAAASLLDGRKAGAGYLLKERIGQIDEFVDTARRVAAGECVVDPILRDR